MPTFLPISCPYKVPTVPAPIPEPSTVRIFGSIATPGQIFDHVVVEVDAYIVKYGTGVSVQEDQTLGYFEVALGYFEVTKLRAPRLYVTSMYELHAR